LIQAGDWRGRQVKQRIGGGRTSNLVGRRRHIYGSYVSAGPGISISYSFCIHFPVIRSSLVRRIRIKSDDLVSPA
jgi:hypothetical protein